MKLSFLLIALLLRPAPFTPVHHFELVRSTPAKNATIKAGRDSLQMWFTQVPAAGVSRVTLKTAQGAAVAGKTTIVPSEKSMYFDPDKPLVRGRYIISWRGAGDDGHVMSGTIPFAVSDK
jgi:methionine-rich copper-binding protein CopC